MARQAPSGAQAVLRAIALLKAFTLEKPARDVAELAEETGLSRSTVHRLLSALESEGLVVRDARRGTQGPYRLGPTAAALGVRALRSSKLRESVHPELQKLARETGETATLEVLAENKMLILDEVLGARLIGAAPSLGTAWALHATSTGKALLSALPEERVRELVPAKLERFTRNTITSWSRLMEVLAEARERGYAAAREEIEDGYSAVGAIIRLPMIEPYAALSLGGPSGRFDDTRIRELGALVRTRAAEISSRLGFEG